MKKKGKRFWALYILWVVINVVFLILAVYDTFGEFNKTTEEFWPFTIGSPRYFDFVELFVYLGIPLAIYYLTRMVHSQHKIEQEN
jgi:hypothetical protein